MAHGEKTRSKAWKNMDFYARRPMSHTPYSHRAGTNKKTKRLCHGMERARERKLVQEEKEAL